MVHNSKLEFQLRKQIENCMEFLRFRSVWKQNETVFKTNRFEFWPNNKYQIVKCTAIANCSPYLCVACILVVHCTQSMRYCVSMLRSICFSSFRIVCWFIFLPEKRTSKIIFIPYEIQNHFAFNISSFPFTKIEFIAYNHRKFV